MQNENQATAVKQEYQTPRLDELGPLSELTLAGGTNHNDGTTQSAN